MKYEPRSLPTLRAIRAPFALALIASLGLAACASPNAPLMARSPQRRPDLTGRSIAILPPTALRGEGGPAAGWERATRQIWGTRLAGVDAISLDRIREVLAADPEAYARVRARALRGLPIDDQPSQGRRTLVESRTIGGVEYRNKVWVTMRSSIGGLGVDATTLPTEWLARFGADYVLFSVSFRSAAQDTRIFALYGLVPFWVRSEVEAQRPRGNLLLYDAATGELAWAAYVGGERSASSMERLPDSYWPPLAAAHLLTGALEEALVRLLGDPE